jgi:hypothetical protein
VSATKLLITAMISAVLCFGLAVCARAQEARHNSSDRILDFDHLARFYAVLLQTQARISFTLTRFYGDIT